MELLLRFITYKLVIRHFSYRWFYNWYIQSDYWKRKRRRVLAREHHRCKRCKQARYLEVHHLTYKRLGFERMDDLEALCVRCHAQADLERVSRTGGRKWTR